MICPHCKKKLPEEVFDKARRNVEAYGDSSFVLKCPKCLKKFKVWIIVKTVIAVIGQEDKNADLSFGE